MSHNAVPLSTLATAVQNAVQQALGKEAPFSVEKLWVGFVAPDNIATQEIAGKVAAVLGKEAGVSVSGSVAQRVGAPIAGQAHQQLLTPGHIIGLIYAPHVEK